MNQKNYPENQSHPVDVYVGYKLRCRRMMLGITQKKMATLLGVTFQQVQKYEKGINRISASRLWDMSKLLGVGIGYFFEDYQKEDKLSNHLEQNQNLPVEKIDNQTLVLTPESIELVRAYWRIQSPVIMKSLLALIKEMASEN